MRRAGIGSDLQSPVAGFGCILLLCAAACEVRAFAQDSDAAASKHSPAVVTGQSFSASKFTREVHVQRDGTVVVVKEKGHALLARDADGRVFMAGARDADENCDLPNLGKLPVCEVWTPFIFDPAAGVMWHWSEGEIGGKADYIEIDLRSDQITEAERLTSVLPSQPGSIYEGVSEPGIRVQDLGERDIEGVRARGVRSTTVHNPETGGPKKTIREVWISEEMHLVVKVIDGDPEGDEVISGLDHISRSPKAELFQPPTERILRRWPDHSEYADPDITELAGWFVR